MNIPKTIPFGRIPDLRSHPDANLIALKPGREVFTDCTVKRYASRLALETFLQRPGAWYALVKTPTERNMVTNPAFQKAI